MAVAVTGYLSTVAYQRVRVRAGQAVEEKSGESSPTRNATAAVTPPLVSFQPFIEIFPGHFICPFALPPPGLETGEIQELRIR